MALFRLIGLKDQIMPVYEEMQIKIRVQNNSDAAVKELDKVWWAVDA